MEEYEEHFCNCKTSCKCGEIDFKRIAQEQMLLKMFGAITPAYHLASWQLTTPALIGSSRILSSPLMSNSTSLPPSP
jgi:hypothetical protein